jgi:Ring finger domain
VKRKLDSLSPTEDEEKMHPIDHDEELGKCEIQKSKVRDSVQGSDDITKTITDDDLLDNGYLMLHPSSIKAAEAQFPNSQKHTSEDNSTTDDNYTSSLEDEGVDQLNTTIRRGRSVPNCCAICLGSYEVDDIVVWSSNESDCQHAFHEDCMIEWMCKMQTGTPCPLCRQNFLPELHQYYNGKYIKKYNQVAPQRTFDLSRVSLFGR